MSLSPEPRMCDEPDPEGDGWTPDEIGVRAERHVDGEPHGWSWACKCGAWNDLYKTRAAARRSYRRHREHHCSGEDVRDEYR